MTTEQLNNRDMRRTFIEAEKRQFKLGKISKNQYKINVKEWLKMDAELLKTWFDKFFKFAKNI